MPANAGDSGLIPGSGRSPGGRNSSPLQYSCLGNPMDRRSLVGYSPWGCKRIRHSLATKEQVSRSTVYECEMQQYDHFLQHKCNHFLFILQFNKTLCEIMKQLDITPIWRLGTHWQLDSTLSLETHSQGCVVLVPACFLTPRPLDLAHYHLKNILVDPLRDSNSPFGSSYPSLFLRFYYSVATGRALFWKP